MRAVHIKWRCTRVQTRFKGTIVHYGTVTCLPVSALSGDMISDSLNRPFNFLREWKPIDEAISTTFSDDSKLRSVC